MRIFVDIRSLDTPIRSGIPEYASALVDALLAEKDGNEYVFFANSFRKNLESLPLKDQCDAWVNWKVPNRILDAANFILKRPRIDLAVKADVYFSPHFNSLSFKEPQRHVITIHDISFAYFPEFFPRRKNLWHAEQGWQQQVKEAGRVITVSDATRENILDLFHLPEEKVVRIYPGIKKDCRPLPKDTPGLVDFRDKYFLQAPFFLYVGTLEPRKNLIGLVRAFNIVKAKPANRDLKLVVAGAPGWLYDKIFKEIKASPHSNDIVVWGPATEEEILNLYNLATAFVYPSFFEGFGFPPLEAQKCGCPVVASNRSSLPEVLGSSALLADPYRLEELASAMEAAATDGELRKELIKKGFENSARFAWEKTVGETVKIFKAINI